MLLMSLSLACEREVDIENTELPPAVEPSDKPFVGVYTPLDGDWAGVFRIYRDTAPSSRDQAALQTLSADRLEDSTLILEDSILVTQSYVSETPYFQTVEIRDYYPATNDTIYSEGANKVQDGEMWCVIKKPDETVIHRGNRLNGQTITWQRKQYDPFVEEYFYETVNQNTYEIIGWGYYGTADTTMSPPMWFYGRYERQ